MRCSDDAEKPKNAPQVFPGFPIIKSARHCGKITIFLKTCVLWARFPVRRVVYAVNSFRGTQQVRHTARIFPEPSNQLLAFSWALVLRLQWWFLRPDIRHCCPTTMAPASATMSFAPVSEKMRCYYGFDDRWKRCWVLSWGRSRWTLEGWKSWEPVLFQHVSTIWWNGYAVSITCISIGCNFGIERWSKIDRFCLRSTGVQIICCVVVFSIDPQTCGFVICLSTWMVNHDFWYPLAIDWGITHFRTHARKEVHDFTPFCVHQDAVGAIPGIHWDMAKTVEKYEASWEVRHERGGWEVRSHVSREWLWMTENAIGFAAK